LERILNMHVYVGIFHLKLLQSVPGFHVQLLSRLKKGDEGVAIGYYFRVLAVLGLDKDLLLVAKDDELGRRLQDSKLVVKERASKK